MALCHLQHRKAPTFCIMTATGGRTHFRPSPKPPSCQGSLGTFGDFFGGSLVLLLFLHFSHMDNYATYRTSSLDNSAPLMAECAPLRGGGIPRASQRKWPCRSMDRTKVSGTLDVGSIPAGAISQTNINPTAPRSGCCFSACGREEKLIESRHEDTCFVFCDKCACYGFCGQRSLSGAFFGCCQGSSG